MPWLPLVVIFPTLCFIQAYGIQKRKRWAWVGGWIFGFFAAGAVCALLLPTLLSAEQMSEIIPASVFLAGALCLWLFWAIWWATHGSALLRN